MGVADQHGLSVCLLDAIEQRRKDARLRHTCLVDDDHAANREILGQQPVQRRRVDAGLVLELLGGDARRRCAEDGHPGLAERLADSAGGGRLARPGESDDADDAVGGAVDCAHHRRLLARQDTELRSEDILDDLPRDRGRVDLAPSLDEGESCLLVSMSSEVE